MKSNILFYVILVIGASAFATEKSMPLMQREYVSQNNGEYECEIKELDGKYFVYQKHEGQEIGKAKQVELSAKDFDEIKSAESFKGNESKVVPTKTSDKAGYMTFAGSGSLVRYAVRSNPMDAKVRVVLIAQSGAKNNTVQLTTRGYSGAVRLAERIDQLCK